MTFTTNMDSGREMLQSQRKSDQWDREFEPYQEVSSVYKSKRAADVKLSTPQAKFERPNPTRIVNTKQSKSEQFLPDKYGIFNEYAPQNTNQSVFS